MITYAHAVIWIWTVALVATLVALAAAWRAVARSDAAVASLRIATDGLSPVGTGSVALADEIAAARVQRDHLVTRSQAGGDRGV